MPSGKGLSPLEEEVEMDRRFSGEEAEDEEKREPATPAMSHRRSRSLNSITLRRSAATSGKVVTRTGLLPSSREESPDRKHEATQVVSQLVEEARSSLNEMVDDARHSIEELAQTVSRRPDRKYRRSLRWYGAASNISNETMVPATYDDTIAIDDARCALLDQSRRLNPLDIVMRLDLTLTASILPRVVRSSVAIVVFGAYAATAVMKRFAYIGGRKGDEDDTVVKLSIFVSFIIVFYSNHCYTRFYRHYESVKLCCLLITDAVTMARSLSVLRPLVPCDPSPHSELIKPVRPSTQDQPPPGDETKLTLPAGDVAASRPATGAAAEGPPNLKPLSQPPRSASQQRREHLAACTSLPSPYRADAPSSTTINDGRITVGTLERLYRYLNVAHVAGYTALSPTYTRENLFVPFVAAHGLLTHAEWRAFKRQSLDVDDPSGAAFHEFVAWAMTAIGAARDRGEIASPNETVALQDVVIRFRGAMQGLFDERFQEIPFAYSHLVSFLSFVYLLVLAVASGLKFGQKEPIASGLIFPALAVFFTTVVLLGLLTLGKAMSQPTGLDPEAFPIFSYLDSTAIASRRIIHAKAYNKRPYLEPTNDGYPEPPRQPPPTRRRHTSGPPAVPCPATPPKPNVLVDATAASALV